MEDVVHLTDFAHLSWPGITAMKQKIPRTGIFNNWLVGYVLWDWILWVQYSTVTPL